MCAKANAAEDAHDIASSPGSDTTANTAEASEALKPMYMDDPYGGFKGIRTSPETKSWETSGDYITVHQPPTPASGRAPLPPVRVFSHAWKGEAVSTTTSSSNDIGAIDSAGPDVLILPGYPCPSYLARNFAEELLKLQPTARVIAFDWPGIGQSDAPQDGVGGFSYTLSSFEAAARRVVSEYSLAEDPAKRPLHLVGHGYIGTDIALRLCQSSPSSNSNAVEAEQIPTIASLTLLAPALGKVAHELPKELKKLRNPLMGPLLTGNPAHMADKVFSSATPYNIVEADMMVLRSAYMQSGGPGFAARAIAVNFDWRAIANDAKHAIANIKCPVQFAIAAGDGWLPMTNLQNEVEAAMNELKSAGNGNVTCIDWEYSGHFIFDDAPKDVAKLVSQAFV